jgi:hypothetical protein
MRIKRVHNLSKNLVSVAGLQFVREPRLGLRVRNASGAAIATDKVVALTTLYTTGGIPLVVLADADNPAHRDLYVTAAAINDGAEGFVYKAGLSEANLDTNSVAAAGDLVYLSGTAGAFAVSAPMTSVQSAVVVGTVVVKSATVGQILWHIRNGAPLAGHALQIRRRFTIAEANAGATIVPAPGTGFKLRMVDYKMIAIGANAAAVTTVDILGTQATASAKLAAVAVAGLTRSTVNTPTAANNTVLADGASFAANDANTAMTIGKTGSNVTTATDIDVVLTYAVDPA